ncbi:hypothetical protein FHU26_004991 [Clostridium beijerinckii]|nr:hypothetical protein [Clostridium beijerinckii]
MSTAIIITVGLFFILAIPVILFIDSKYKEKRNFQCTKCFHIFDILKINLIVIELMGNYMLNALNVGNIPL